MSESKDTLFNSQLFQTSLETKEIGRSFIYRRETETTMKIAEREMNEGAAHGTLILAETQTHGRGRVEGRHWISNAGNLYFTLLLIVDTKEALKVNLACNAAIVYAAREEGVNAKTKWPNDVWIAGKKVSGMLIDANSTGLSSCLQVGVGINVNQDFTNHPDLELRDSATSLSNAIGVQLSREIILANFCNRLEYLLSLTMNDVLAEYIKYDMLKGKKIVVMPKKKEVQERKVAIAKGFSSFGLLQVQYEDSSEVNELTAEEVTIRPEDVDSQVKLPSLDANTVINGEWENLLGSKMYLMAQKDGRLEGHYYSAVGNVKFSHPLSGRWCALKGGQALIGWTVCWTNLKNPGKPMTTTSWSGKVTVEEGEEIKIFTSWFLTSDLKRKDYWKSVLTNQDIFVKLK